MAPLPNITTLGDPHLGRSFVHGVPLARRGQREAMVRSDFIRSLTAVKTPYHINMGDLFDATHVSYDTLLFAASNYIVAAEENRNCEFLILQGNHDVSRDLERTSAFDVFSEIVRPYSNIHVFREVDYFDDFLLVPFDPVTPTAELVLSVYETTGLTPSAAFGHWDIQSFGGTWDEPNLIPTEVLSKIGCKIAYTGHVHQKQTFTRDDVEVIVTGSMQPYAHGEGDMYVTIGLDELDGDFTNKCVRVVLKDGEVLDREIDCLQLTVVREALLDDDNDVSVSLGDFNMEELFKQAFDSAGVKDDLRARTLDQYSQLRANQ